MASMSNSLAIISIVFVFLPHLSSSSSIITIPLSIFNTNSHQNPYQKLSHLASLSLARAHHIKYPHKSPISTTPLFPHSYGAYSISLSFGTPPQPIPFILDTGSSFVWFPCTRHYACKNCTTTRPHLIPSFIPKASSTAKILGCVNPKCTWIHTTQPNPASRCRDCQGSNLTNCTQICPPYFLIYGSGSTAGVTLVETLELPNKRVPGFVVGCSLFSSHQPAGIAGFGRGVSSMPSQLGLKKFSYCLLSHKFDDSGDKSMLILDSDEKSMNLSYTPLLKNPVVPGKTSFSEYYYVGLRKISVGGHSVEIPYKYLTPDRNGNGGAIVDSGTTFTFMIRGVLEPVWKAFAEQVKQYKRVTNVESQTGLRPCFNVSGRGTVSLPEVKFHFKGGAEMALPLENYFSIVDSEVVCLTMVTSDFYASELNNGPSIILGNFQMQNFHVEYDLKNERFGFQQQLCR